jgi:hypothetical protein
VLKRSDTWNATANRYDYPQTPSRLQLSLWPAGLPSNGQGTITWAGGLVDWNSQDIQQHGYYYATFGEVDIQCYDPPSGANIQGNTSYIYTDVAATNNTVEITGNSTILSSFDATGTNMTAGSSTSSASGTAASSSASDSSDSIPGENGGSGSGGSAQSNPNFNSSSSTNTNSNSTSTGFSQGGSSTAKGSGASLQSERVLQGSLFAVLVAVVVLVAM